ncbi:2-phospho-L-lactate guanylyltransferase [Marinomonas agarivorans]|nr:2-phospho-L-lactate guanylyltransferase [Marinomonas agarivorans]
MKTCLVMPMKSPHLAKQRLAGHLTDEDRAALALMLFEKSVSFFRSHFADLPLLVVSHSESVLALAQEYGCQTVWEEQEKGLNQALQKATNWVKRAGFSQQIIIPSDIAHLTSDEIQTLLQHANQYQVVIARAKDGGTNALITTPPDAIEFYYGVDSAAKHQKAAKHQQCSCLCLDLMGLRLDIDSADDLANAHLQWPQNPMVAATPIKGQQLPQLHFSRKQYV